MKGKEPRSMSEIHKVQEEIYRQTKGMSMRQKIDFYNSEAKNSLRQSKHGCSMAKG